MRSADGRTAAGDLWISQGGTERLVVAAADIASGAELNAAEAARRERLREVTSGITSYSTDADLRRAVFALDGDLFVVDLDTAQVTRLTHELPAVDPRISPDGTHVASVHGGALHVFSVTEGTNDVLCTPESKDVTYGLADFIAAEELERHRGHWWITSSALLVERVDEADVPVRWIGDPAQPETEPRPHRYPAAGMVNPEVSLELINVQTRERCPINWNRDEFPYLAQVTIAHERAIVSVLSRDQTREHVFAVEPSGAHTFVGERRCEPWITVFPGTPTLDARGRLIDIRDVEGTFRLCRDGAPLSPGGLQIDDLICVDGDIWVGYQPQPTTHHIARITAQGWEAVTDPSVSAWFSAVAQGDTYVLVQADTSSTRSHFSVRTTRDSVRRDITSNAELSVVQPAVHLHTVGPDHLNVAVLLPQNVSPTESLPVICSPYGGPHAQRVIAAAGAFTTEQWLANQGFAVVVIDGRGTPGRGPAWEYAVHHDLATGVLADQVQGLQHIAALYPQMDTSRVGIRGWSFGGYLAALAVLERPDAFHAAVAGAPVTEWRLYDTAYTERYLGLPQINPEVYDANSLLTKAAHLTRPLLFIHGLADDNVLAAHTLQMSSALLAAGKPHSVLPLSGVTHMTPQEIVAENLLLTEVDFFHTHLANA